MIEHTQRAAKEEQLGIVIIQSVFAKDVGRSVNFFAKAHEKNVCEGQEQSHIFEIARVRFRYPHQPYGLCANFPELQMAPKSRTRAVEIVE